MFHIIERPEESRAMPARGPVKALRIGGLAPWQLRRVLAHIEAHLESRMVIESLADVASLSPSYFSRAFKQSAGVSPKTYLIRRRVERAKALIVSGGDELKSVALHCGFADQAHLTRMFRREVGVSPGLWRRLQVNAVV